MSFRRTTSFGMSGRGDTRARVCAGGWRLASAKRLAALALAGLMAAAPLSGCSLLQGTASTTESDSQDGDSAARTPGDIDLTSLFSDRDQNPSYDESEAVTVTLADDGTTASGSGVEVEGSTVTITKAGTYLISGSLSDGQLVVDADGEKVQLVLNGASISSSTSTALYVRDADKVFLTLADGSTNTITSAGEDVEADDHNLDGAIWSHDDLTVNGSGTLTVSSACGHGIVSKDDLTLVNGTVSVTAAVDALQAKGELAVGGGSWTLSAGDDGMHSDSDLVIVDGTIDVTQSYEGLEGATVTVTGGTANVISSDDGINASGASDDEESTDSSTEGSEASATTDGTQPQGTMEPPAQDGQLGATDDAASGDGQTPPELPSSEQNGGANESDANGGEAPAAGEAPSGQTGDGQAPTGMAGGQVPSEMGGGQAPTDMGGGMDEDDETAYVYVCGGSLTINAEGDGIDSNGDLLISAGEVYVEGSTGDGDGALDYAGTGQISGGTIVALGSTGMAQSLEATGDQGVMLVTISGDAGSTIALTDAKGSELASYTATKSYACAVVSCAGLTEGESYTLSNGSQSVEVTMDSATYSDVTGGMGGQAGGDQGSPGQGGPGNMGGGADPNGTSDSAQGDAGDSAEATQESTSA